MIDKLKKYFEQDIALCVISGLKKGADCEYSKVTVRPYQATDGVKFQFEYTVKAQVKHKNVDYEQLVPEIAQLLENYFTQCMVYGRENDYHINCFNSKIKAKTMPPSKKVALKAHNKKKEYILNEGENIDFLVYLGVMTQDGRVVKARYNKFRQINKYLELLKTSLDVLPQDRPLKIVDFGCGKAYLTFALYYYVVKILGREADITGLDLKEDVIDYCNKVAKDLGYETLEFQKGDIKDYDRTQDVDMVIMLHACDNATDEGIVQSLRFNAKIIIAVPCCQHEFFKQIHNDNLQPILQFGILKERFSALATDSLRAQILKAIGFDVSVMEFIDTEHTPKNLAIRAIRNGGFNQKEYDNYAAFRDYLNLTPYIERRLREEKILEAE
ncbi:MAG: SAM-dependent methyltransferase [Oscillospiraceae bacterium]|nr:SAM-dependent methyltransferase [Oscillospiraceae bacterium]